jgi:WD40 repeat protein
MNENSILGSNIKIIKFKSRNFVTRLKRHKNRIIIIKHYFNYKKKQDFILSGDINHIVNIWNVSYKENPFIYYIKYNGNNIYNFVPVCIEEKNDIDYFLLIYDNTINMYHLNKGMFIKNINHFPCEEEKIINLLSWKNKNNKLDYIIKCTKHRIIIFNFIDEDIVFQLSNKIKNEKSNVIIQKVDSIYKSEGYIISNKTSDYLCIFTSDMNIEIWDLYSLSLKESISMKINLIDDIHLINFIPWNNKYTLIINGNYIYVFDIENKNIISKMIGCFRNTNRQIYYKKTTSNIYGQSLLFWCNNKYISLLSTNDFSLKIFD